MNLLLIVIDTLRVDHLSCYGYFRNTSPNIDSLAKEGVLFEEYFASGVPTGPAFTSLVTGMFPINHKFYITPYNIPNAYQLDDNILTLSEVLWENGYTTVAFDNLMNFRSRMKHLVRGFEYYINVTGTSQWLAHHVWAEKINRRLLPWIKEHRKESFFIFLHYWDPHTPYNQPKKYQKMFNHEKGVLSDLEVKTAPAGYEYIQGWGKKDSIFEGKNYKSRLSIPGEVLAEKCSIDLYDGEIAYVDSCIGKIIENLKNLDLYDETMVVVTADHGEQLGQHGLYGHAGLHDANIHLPLVITYPYELTANNRIKEFAQHVDVPTTILNVMNIDYERHLEEMRSHAIKFGNPAYNRDIKGFSDGKDLLSKNKVNRTRGEVFTETQNLLPKRIFGNRIGVSILGQRGIRTQDWKLIIYTNGRREMYNVKYDPMETINLVDENELTLENLKNKLESWIKFNLKGREDPIYRTPTNEMSNGVMRKRHSNRKTGLREIGKHSLDSKEPFRI